MQEVPWTVYEKELAVHEVADRESPVIRALSAGDTVTGLEMIDHETTNEEWLRVAEGWVSMTGLLHVYPANVVKGNLVPGAEVIDRWWGMPIEYIPDDLEEISSHHCVEQGRVYLLRREVRNVLSELLYAAHRDGVEIRINSAYRSGEYQARLYRRACQKDGYGQRYSARPGHSEHQLGTTVDFTDPGERFAFEHAFQDTDQCRWLTENAGGYGFVRSYTDTNIAETGYISEPWHWRFKGR